MKVRKLIAFIVSLSLVILFIGCWPNRKTNPRALLFAKFNDTVGLIDYQGHGYRALAEHIDRFETKFFSTHEYSDDFFSDESNCELFCQSVMDHLEDIRDNRDRKLYSVDSVKMICTNFEDSYGYLPDTDGDDTPDLADQDDDNDGVPDTRDDDDDNDGCLDRDEADGNLGGHTADELSGEGRGEGIDPGEKVDKDDPNFDPPEGSTRHNDL
jgi:hypothetical protein